MASRRREALREVGMDKNLREKIKDKDGNMGKVRDEKTEYEKCQDEKNVTKEKAIMYKNN